MSRIKEKTGDQNDIDVVQRLNVIANQGPIGQVKCRRLASLEPDIRNRRS